MFTDSRKELDGNYLFKYCRIFTIINGTWKIDLRGKWLLFSNLNFYTAICLGTLFQILAIIDLFQNLIIKNWLFVFANLSITTTTISGSFKAILCRSKTISQTIKKIQQIEVKLLSTGDENLKKMYSQHVTTVHIATNFLVIISTCGTSLFIISTMITNHNLNVAYVNSNYTGVPPDKTVVFRFYGFDWPDRHWNLFFVCEIIYGVIGYSFYEFSNTIIISIFVFNLFQLRALKFKILHFNDSAKEKVDRQKLQLENAQWATFLEILAEHRQIIGMIKQIDQTLKNFMLIDFFVMSIKVSVTLLTILGGAENVVLFAAVSLYTIALLAELYYFYWNGHEIIDASSEQLSMAFFHCGWIDFDEKLKKNFMMMIVRTRVACSLSIGPFYKMTLQSGFSILKAVYTYTLVFIQIGVIDL